MTDVDRVIRRGHIEVVARDEAALRGLGVVVLEADHPLARRRLRGALAHRVLDGLDGAQVAVDEAKVPPAGVGGVAVPVDETGHDSAAAEVDSLRARHGQRVDVGVRADREDAVPRDRDRLGGGLSRVDRDQLAVSQDEVWLCACQCERAMADQGERGQRARVADNVSA